MKYIFFSYDGSIKSVAEKLINEGNSVIVADIDDKKLTYTDDELKQGAKKEDTEEKKLRLSLYDGIIKKSLATKVIKKMKELSNKKDYFVFSDSNASFRFTELSQEYGYKGQLITQEDRIYEVDRKKGKEIVEKYYPNIYVMDYQEFKTIEDGIKYLEDNPDNIYVLKSMGDGGDTIVPTVDDPVKAKELIINSLNENKGEYEQGGFLLEQKIINGVELTPSAVFWDGQLVFTDLDIETKTMGAGENGIPVGCGTNLIIKTDPRDELNKMAFPKYVFEEAKKRKGFFIIDAGLLFDKRTGKPYFTEFCYQRFGWDSFPTELAMSDSVSSYFENVIDNKDPLKKRFGVSARLFDVKKKDGRLILIDDEIKNNTYLYDVKKEDDKLVTVGYMMDIGIVVNADASLQEAINGLYEKIKTIGIENVMYRPKDDFISTSYNQAILNRLKYAVENKLIRDDGILEEIDKITGSNVDHYFE